MADQAPRPAREFVVEADGGSRGNPGPAGYGAVVLDPVTGEALVEAAEYLGVVTNNVAEYRGLLAGLRAAAELDPDATVHVRMDSKLVVEQMSGRWKIKHPDMKPLAAEAARVFPPGRVTYEWIPRASNKHADRLANEAMDAGARGEAWSPSDSTAELDAAAADRAAPAGRTAGSRRTGAASAVAPAGTEGGDGGEPAPDGGGAAAGEPLARAGRDRVDAASLGAGTRAATSTGASATGTSGTGASATGTSGTGASATGAPGLGVAAETSGEADVRAAKVVASPGWGPPDMGAPATFVLLRHGETPLTPQKRFSGSGGSDPSLSPVGREQAERVAASLARRGTIEAVVASPLARTRETAGIVAARLGLEVAIEEGLRETDFGAWEGLTFGEVRERHPADLDAWLASPDAEPTGGGESFAATGTRIAATRDRLVAAYAGRTVLLVSHVTPIKTFVRLALGAPPESLFRMELSAASLSAVAYYADGGASVRLFNETSHLR
ncbi:MULTISPECIES: bifunctional RNase H/acid phosphatase [Streptomyces]|uniref:Bifunctional protein (Ribonuclease H/phosphoglycerate mutase) n=1 Tax=Streptomyces coelicolor (strain ATCC BAA-471 / A3(2) / M145) TaxID=100226 RepID=Q9L014_STRCO|nr:MULTISPECIES: bifunctional RNase H/acid phosphatase [Streptomyces]MYU41825.1 bifunctional RNase H/acid phosphatase [Streptomyces sp. SID7813]MDX2928714.1 bifunctional RNase H/acid phosphatase [Streptomyces sp. NRRL_B-16638]MDX3411348.1 bifunctional RNase H/acid phosphatase [Streptomyces sp. ME02-6977A]QFI42450.1 bifunctional RNase H/acid phosphatase [Streptomyces coelicolor A3(2)]TYP15090.1 putative phosphoglycerate mutase [Streptomyces coelicolor]